MPDAALFVTFGFFARPQFLEAELCAQIRAEMRAAHALPATVHEQEGRYGVDERRRSTAWAGVSPRTESVVRQRLLSVMPRVGSHFGLALSTVQSLQFLIYHQGDYFRPHRDRNEGEDAAPFSRRRQVSVILFLDDRGCPRSRRTLSGGPPASSAPVGSVRGD
jgi:predicted 2-oxoglutarate/Fe(II)-dependent dioxygenase YbiX